MSVADTPVLLEEARQGDNDACTRLIEENAGLIWSIVRRYAGRGVDTEDLYQLGCLGFLKAVRGFDPDYGCQFSTYAVPKIAGEIRRFLRDDGPVKVSRSFKEQAVIIRVAREKLAAAQGRDPTLSELAAATGLQPEEIAAAEDATSPVLSLQMETGDGTTLEGLLGTEGMEERIVEREALHTAISSLPERDRKVVLLRYFKGLTQDKTAKVLGVSQVQVSRLERKAVERLRTLLVGEREPPPSDHSK
ncbi:MAG: sigma-70 family RNA polymerase sigma factor [Oscillospiraceae bacterium]|nr:sigma-70 family RNA polymerase sigma factor [Oscillospiraceae bacterium]